MRLVRMKVAESWAEVLRLDRSTAGETKRDKVAHFADPTQYNWYKDWSEDETRLRSGTVEIRLNLAFRLHSECRFYRAQGLARRLLKKKWKHPKHKIHVHKGQTWSYYIGLLR